MRTKAERLAAKKRLKKPAGKLLPIDLHDRSKPDWMTRAYQNNRYIVMINDNVPMTDGITAVKAFVQTVDEKPIKNHWREMQNIKNELFGPETTAIEYYPAESQLVDKANIYWLWILPENALPKPRYF